MDWRHFLLDEEDDVSLEDLEEIHFLSEINRDKPSRFRGQFDLNKFNQEECVKNFRFTASQIDHLCEALQLPNHFVTENQCTIPALDGLCLLLRRLAYPCRLHDLEQMFGKDLTVLSRLFNVVLDHVHDKFCHLLSTFEHSWINEDELAKWAAAITAKGCPFETCVGFLDGTNIEICRPGDYAAQRLIYSGYTYEHDLKYWSIMSPCGIMISFYGPYPGSHHDSRMLWDSGVQDRMALKPIWNPPGQLPYHLFGDQAYKSTAYITAPFHYNLTPEQIECNDIMESLRVCVEWGFGKISQLFAFTEFAENQKLSLQPIGKYHRVAAILTNCHTCLEGSNTAKYYRLTPPSLEVYLGG